MQQEIKQQEVNFMKRTEENLLKVTIHLIIVFF